MALNDLLLIAAGTLTALVAGLFFGFAVAVNGGLHRLRDSEYVRAMQSINRVILNPLFLLSFMLPMVLLPLAAFLHRDESAAFVPLVIASVLYIAGVFGITSAGNVPLNERLDKFDSDRASDANFAKARAAFERPWNRLHNIRTILAIAATILVFVACLRI